MRLGGGDWTDGLPTVSLFDADALALSMGRGRDCLAEDAWFEEEGVLEVLDDAI